MKKILKLVLASTLLCCCLGGKNIVYNTIDLSQTKGLEAVAVSSATVIDLQTHAKSAYLMDFDTQTVVYNYQENMRLPIASMCKIMTLILNENKKKIRYGK